MLSIALATLSLACLSALIGARVVRQRRDKGLIVWRKHLTNELLRHALSGGDHPVVPMCTQHQRDIVTQIALDAFSILDDDARARLTDVLCKVSLDASLRRAARRGRIPRRVAAIEALRLFPGFATHRILEQAQVSSKFRICLAALRTRVELGDLPHLSTVLKLTERPEGGRSLSLFKIVEACVRADLPVALHHLTPGQPPRARIMLLKAIGATGSWAAFRDIANASIDPDPEVRAAALTALRAMAVPAALPIFTDATRDLDWQVRLKAVEGIGQLGSREDRATIETLLDDPVWWIRFRADEALHRLDGRGAELRLTHAPPKSRKRRASTSPGLAAAS
jgi:HEAT repeats